MIKEHMYQISLEDIERYLLDHKWKQSQHPNKTISFISPPDADGNKIEVNLPINKNFQDYDRQISDVLRVIALVQEKEIINLKHEISLLSHDVFKARLLNVNSSGTISLTTAACEVTALRDLIVYAACSEQKSLPYYERSNSSADYYAEQCQFGHTFQGSFGFTIHTPIIANYSELSLFEEGGEIPFERRVVERIVRSFELINRSVSENNVDIIVDNFETGLNSRMCEALLEISQKKQQLVEFDIIWSSKISVSEDLQNKTHWSFNKAAYDILEYAAEELKKVKPFKDTIIGQIITLHSTKSPMSEDTSSRHAIIRHEHEGRIIKVKLELNREQYNLALDGHKQGQAIRIEGNLFKKGNLWKMIDVTDLKILL